MNQDNKVVKIKDVVYNQIPEFILPDNPNFVEFLKQYYTSQEFQGSNVDLAENLIQYKNFDAFDNENLYSDTVLISDVGYFDSEIFVESVSGYPAEYGLIKIDNEIITYTGITTNSFTGCIRGFSGISSLTQQNNPEFLVFSETETSNHTSGSSVQNLSNLFLKEFFKKIKYQFIPGFEEVDFDPRINVPNFISKARSFYETKGTDEAYKILFKVLYGEDVKVIKPDDYTFKPSDDKWTVCESFTCELISGNPTKLVGQTLYQDESLNGKILPASGSIYSVDRFYLKNKTHYKINLFSGYSVNLSSTGSIFGNFAETPKTYVVEDISATSNVITVDSTIGFENSGSIFINEIEIFYTDKTSNQFLNCSGITETIETKTEVYGNNYVYGYDNDDGSQIKLRVIGALSGVGDNNVLYSVPNDSIKVDNLGSLADNAFTKSLIYNLPLTVYSGIITSSLQSYDLEGIDLSNGRVKTLYDHKLKSGDLVDLYRTNFNEKIKSDILVSTNDSLPKQYNINVSGISPYIGSAITAKRKLFKSKSSSYSEINNKFTANIQNSYTDVNYHYVTSNGFPSYEINPFKRQFSFEVDQENYETLIGRHNFYDGELITVTNYSISGTYSNPVGVNTGVSFYVKKIDEESIKLTYSSRNVGVSSYISFYELVNPPTNNSVAGFVSSFTLIDNTLYGNEFTSSKLFKKFPKVPTYPVSDVETPPGSIGILANGIQINNYKSFDKIYYGKIDSVNVLNSGENYDLTNPPRFLIDNGNDTTTTLLPQLTGNIKELVVTDPGFNYSSTPTVTISGGGNNSVKTEVKTKLESKVLEFNASSSAGYISDINDQFNFQTKHCLITGEEIIYQTLGGTAIGVGSSSTEFLINNEVYYVINIGAGTSFRLAYTKSDAISNNYITIREYGAGIQRFVSTNKKLVVDSVNLIDVNTEFKYRKVFASYQNVNHYDNIFIIKEHEFLTDDEVRYSFTGTGLAGISTATNYYIHKIDDDRFKLKTSKTSTSYLNVGPSDETSVHYFEYSPITVNVTGPLEVDSENNVIGTQATVKAVVLGTVTDVKVAPFGNDGYGSENVINLKNPPLIKELTGSGASFEPFVVNGKIIKVIVKNSGSNYFNTVKLSVSGSGYGAKLEPVIVNGSISSVVIVNGGVGYDSSTVINVSSVSKNLKVSANLESWTISDIAKLRPENITQGVILGRKYSYFGNTFGVFYLNSNLWQQFSIPSLSASQNPPEHSPIIGWAYDGCPIYGPDAFANVDGTGGFRRMTSSYRLKSTLPENRPDTSIYPQGFFVDDYEYVRGLGSLDEYNGRFCVTPEFPNGVYAYFCTVSNTRTPLFPYFIGNYYKFNPEQDNFELKNNQDLNFNNLGIFKHTLPYGVENKKHYYEYFNFNEKSEYGEILVKKSLRGNISDIIVIDGGFDYSIGDRISFDNTGTGGSGALAEVSQLSGVEVDQISSSTTSIPNVVLTYEQGSIVGIASTYHNLKDNSYVKITGISSSTFSNLEKFVQITVNSLNTNLTQELPSESVTGIVTSIQVKNSILNFEVGSLIKIDSETLKVLGLDLTNNLVNVLRESGASAHGLGSSISLFPNKFSYKYPQEVNLPNNNQTYYFNPSQSVSTGISTSVGAGNTLSILPLGFGVANTQFIPTGRIFLPNHNFSHGEKIIYSVEQSATPIVVSGIGNLNEIQNLYVVKFDDNVIGLTNSKSSINDESNILLYTSTDNSYLHKFTTSRTVVTSTVVSNSVTVSTAQTHGLSVGDKVYLNVISGITTTYNVSYASTTAKLRINSQNNPQINVYENDTVIFNLSSGTLSGTTFKLYTDPDFVNEYLGNSTSGVEVFKNSTSLKLTISKNTPKILYYNLESSSKRVFLDESVPNFNTIYINPSLYKNVISGISTHTETSFEVNYPLTPENRVYTKNNSSLSYRIISSGITGPIGEVKILSRGGGYRKLPKISGISSNGYGSNLVVISNNIGKILETSVINDEFVLPSDKTLNPFSYGYSSVFVKNNYKVGSLTINDRGSSYLSAPKVSLYSLKNDEIISNFSARVTVKNGSLDELDIVDAGSGLSSTDDKIVFTENDNGVKILGVSTATNPSGVLVTLTLETPTTGFTTSNPLPFSVGDEVFVEGISALGGGFNSSDYNYNFFEVTAIQPAYGSQNAAQITYQLSQYPGIVSIELTLSNNAYVVNSKLLPKVTANLIQNIFYSGETVSDSSIIANNLNDPVTDLIKVKGPNRIKFDDILTGDLSLSKGTVLNVRNSNIILKSSTNVPKIIGWKTQQGNLSSSVQKLPDNDYYQRFSYSLKSKKPMSDWDSIVSDVSHVSGYKKFSDLVIESSPSGISTITTDDSSIINLSLSSYVDVNTVNDFDLVLENVEDYSYTASDIITFNSKILSDYLLSKENLVLSIDDISNLFNTNIPNNVVFQIDEINFDIVSKYLFFVQSSNSFFGDFVYPQFFELLLTGNGDIVNLTSYSYFENNDLGKVSADVLDDNSIRLNYSPTNTFNTLSIRAIREDANIEVGIVTTSYGYARNVAITTSYDSEVSPTQKTIYSIPLSESSSGTLFVGISSLFNTIQSSCEMAFLYNSGSLQYNTYTYNEIVGLGTIGISTSGSNLLITYDGIPGVGVTIYSNLTFLKNTLSSPNSITDALTRLNSSEVSGSYTSGADELVAIVPSEYSASKFAIEVTKTVGLTTQKSFILIDSIHYLQNTYLNNINYSIIGNIDDLQFETTYDTPTDSYILYYTPSDNADYTIRFFEKNILSIRI